MPRYVIERTFPTGLGVAATPAGAMDCRALVDRNAEEGVTWLQSYVSANDKAPFCAYEAPTPEAIRRAAARNGLPVDRTTQVRVLDPHFDA